MSELCRLPKNNSGINNIMSLKETESWINCQLPVLIAQSVLM